MDLLDCTRPRSTGRGSKRRLSYRCIFPNCGYTRMAAGSVLRMGGGQADRAYVLESGELEVRKHDPNGTEEVLALLWPAIGWGEMSPLLNVPQSGSVVAVRDSQLRRVTSANFAYAIKDHPEETLRLLKQLFERSSRANDKLVFRKYLPRIRGHSFRGFGCCFLLDQVSSKGPENDPRMHHAGRQREQPVYKTHSSNCSGHPCRRPQITADGNASGNVGHLRRTREKAFRKVDGSSPQSFA